MALQTSANRRRSWRNSSESNGGGWHGVSRPWLTSPSGLGGLTYTYPERLADETIDCYLAPLVASRARKALVDAYAVALERKAKAEAEGRKYAYADLAAAAREVGVEEEELRAALVSLRPAIEPAPAAAPRPTEGERVMRRARQKQSLMRHAAMWGVFSVFFFLLVLDLQVVGRYGPLAAGLADLPLTVLLLAFSRSTAKLAARVGPRLPLTLGPLLAAAGLALTLRIDGEHRNYWVDVLPAVTVFAIGMVFVVAPLTATVMAAAPTESVGIASGINNAVSRVAGLVAVAAMGALAAWSYAHETGGAGGMPGFGETPAVTMPDAIKALHRTASDAAFAASVLASPMLPWCASTSAST